MDIAVDKGCDPDEVRRIVSAVAEEEPLLSKERDHSIVMSGQDTNCVKMQLKCFTLTADYWTVKYRMTENVYNALKGEGYLTPNLQVDVHEGKRPDPILLTKKSRKEVIEKKPD